MLKAQMKSDGQTGTKILLEAMYRDKVHLAKFVLDALDGEIVDFKTEGAQTPLIASILLPDRPTRCKFIELLLQRGANVNSQDGDGRTALSYACERGCLDAVKILVRNNADPEIVDAWGNTALMYAAVAGHSAVVEFLVRAFKRLGLQVDRQNKAGNSAVEVAKFLGHTECISALTYSSKKTREVDGSSFSCGNKNEKFEIKLGHVLNKLGAIQTCNHTNCHLVQKCIWKARPRIKQNRLSSMGSIEEVEREDDLSFSPSNEQVFSGVLTPKPPPRSFHHSPISKQREVEGVTTSGDSLRPLIQSGEAQNPVFFSPRPSRNSPKRSTASALGILLTPILTNESDNKPDTDKSKKPDFRVRRFHESYYQKRCSLPTSILSPTPPERTLVPLRKSRTVRRREASPCRAEHLESATSTTTFSALSSKLFRRFTSPEFKGDVKEFEPDPVLISGRMPRSETFPQIMKHPKVGSKSSVDSISSVQCEFDFHFRMP
ncbi:ankyrin repeat domain-containing protein 50-like [Labrus mixtus]|uniref:ankyrin repeat domain-containing protein 50-like n=1 Tax=Labrus mixtus TaxID=508554 RepID=UPI0029BFC8DF|nr:ankyrin repeat domain-containing protein 50-like [Labrus mixtus]